MGCPFNSKALGIAEAVMSEASQVVLLLGAAAPRYNCIYLGLDDLRAFNIRRLCVFSQCIYVFCSILRINGN